MKTVWRVFGYLKRYPWMAAGTLTCAILGTLMGLLLTACLSVMRSTKNAAGIVSAQALELAALSDTPIHASGPPPRKATGPSYIPDQYLIQFEDTIGLTQFRALLCQRLGQLGGFGESRVQFLHAIDAVAVEREDSEADD